MAPYTVDFLMWATQGFQCHWLTTLDRRGGDARIRRAFRIALGLPALTSEIEILFECVAPTIWEMSIAEAIDLASDFYWIASNPDQASIANFEKRGLSQRLIIFSTDTCPNDLATPSFG